MLLYIGGDVIVSFTEILAIIDLGKGYRSQVNQEYIRRGKEAGTLEDLSEGNARSLVICRKEAFLSPISSGTLHKRFVQVGN